jgi:hypothetical protein
MDLWLALCGSHSSSPYCNISPSSTSPWERVSWVLLLGCHSVCS